MFNIIHPLLHSSNMHNAHTSCNAQLEAIVSTDTSTSTQAKHEEYNNMLFYYFKQLSTSTNNSTSFFSSLAAYLSFLFSLFPSSPSLSLKLLHQHHLKTHLCMQAAASQKDVISILTKDASIFGN